MGSGGQLNLTNNLRKLEEDSPGNLCPGFRTVILVKRQD